MKLQLKQTEIEAAIAAYISKQGIQTENRTITCDFTMGRKNSGLVVEVSIELAQLAPVTSTVPVQPILPTAQAVTEVEAVATVGIDEGTGVSVNPVTTPKLFG